MLRLLLTLLPGLLAACGPPASGPRRWVVLDAAGPALVVLDGELLPVARVRLRMAADERAARLCGAGPHVLRGDPQGGWRRERVRADGELGPGVELGPVADVLPLGREGALLLERWDGGVRLRRIEPGRSGETWLEGASLRVLAARDEEVLAGGPGGELVRFAPGGPVRSLGRLEGPILGLAGLRGGWVALLGPPAARLVCLDEALRPRLEWTLGTEATGLAVHPAAGAIWTWGARGAMVHDTRGRLLGGFETERGEPVRQVVALADGGALLACPGALVELGPDARVRRTQGGFGDLVDLRLE